MDRTHSRVPEGQATPRLEAVQRALDRHRHAQRAPITPAQSLAFEKLERFVEGLGPQTPWLLDAGCGTGESSFALSKREGTPVVGVDRSAARLAKREGDTSGVLHLRAELSALWQQMARAKLICERAYLLYPNPYPKTGQVGRRWHGQACFDDILRTCRSLELRTNWEIYAQEFAHALQYRLGRPHLVEAMRVGSESADALSHFELKYSQSGHALYRVCAGPKPDAATVERKALLEDDPPES